MPLATLLWLAVLGLGALVGIDRLGAWAESKGWIYWRKRSARSASAAFSAIGEIAQYGDAPYAVEAEAQSSIGVDVESGAPPRDRHDGPQADAPISRGPDGAAGS